MPKPYSYDFRKKVVGAVDRGEKKSDVARFFQISRNTLELWLKLREQTHDVAPKTDYHRRPQPKIDDLKLFEEFAQKNGHLTQKQMALKWHEPVSKTRIGQALKKKNRIYSQKKNLYLRGR